MMATATVTGGCRYGSGCGYDCGTICKFSNKSPVEFLPQTRDQDRIVPCVIGFMLLLVTNCDTYSSLTLNSIRSIDSIFHSVIDAIFGSSSSAWLLWSASAKCDLNLIILNYIVTCISFQFHLIFVFVFSPAILSFILTPLLSVFLTFPVGVRFVLFFVPCFLLLVHLSGFWCLSLSSDGCICLIEIDLVSLGIWLDFSRSLFSFLRTITIL